MAYFVTSPFSLDGGAVDRSSTPYLLAAALLVAGGALWPVLLVPAVAKQREIPPLQPASRVDAVVYTVGITVLCSVSTFAVLAAGAGHEAGSSSRSSR